MARVGAVEDAPASCGMEVVSAVVSAVVSVCRPAPAVVGLVG